MAFTRKISLIFALMQKQEQKWAYVIFSELPGHYCNFFARGELTLNYEHEQELLINFRALRRRHRVKKLQLCIAQEQVSLHKVYLDTALNPLADGAAILINELDLEQPTVLQDYFYDYQVLNDSSGTALQAYQLALLPKKAIKILLQILNQSGFKLVNLKSDVPEWASMNLLPWRTKLHRYRCFMVLVESTMLPCIILLLLSLYLLFIEHKQETLKQELELYQPNNQTEQLASNSSLTLANFNKVFTLKDALPMDIRIESAKLEGAEWYLRGSLSSLDYLAILSEELVRLGFILPGKSPTLYQQEQHYLWVVNE